MYFPSLAPASIPTIKCGARPKSSIIRTAVPAAIITHLSSRPFKRWMFFSRKARPIPIYGMPWIFRPEHRHWRLHKFCWDFLYYCAPTALQISFWLQYRQWNCLQALWNCPEACPHFGKHFTIHLKRLYLNPAFSVSQNKEFILSSITSKSSSTIISAFLITGSRFLIQAIW